MSEQHVHHHHSEEERKAAAKKGATTFLLSFLLWAAMLGSTLFFGHTLANWMAEGH